MTQANQLAGRTAVVTGASRGIGAAIAVTLSAAGARVALLARSESAIRAVAEKIGNGAEAIVCDVTDPTSVEDAAAVIRDKFGGAPDILVNNAGMFQIKPIADIAPDEFLATLQTGVVAAFLLVRQFLPAMYERKSGNIVTIGSSADRTAFAGNSAYAASKFGARALHEVLRAESRGTGVRTTLLSPSSVDTSLWQDIRFLGSEAPPDRSNMIQASSVASAVLYAVTQPPEVTIEELRMSRS
ncbi:MAG TPA: SDR family oxidoreductase [Gemmatimonadaceae bacterium]|nr:SDR family oxidoreductase [Gemmatimonadaceae bacterium]